MEEINLISKVIRQVRNPDFNARSPVYGGAKLDKKGTACLDLLGRHGLVSVRLADQLTYTFMRNNRKPFIDVMATDLVSA